MAATIITRTYGDGVDQKIGLNGQQIGRKLTAGTNWNKLRVGMRCTVDPTGNTGDFTPAFAFGLCSGTTNMYNDGTTTNFLGCTFRAGIAWTFFSNVWVQSGGAPVNITKRVNTTTTQLSLGLSSWYAQGLPASNRQYFIFDILKGSPNYTVGVAAYQTLSATDQAYVNLIDFMESPPGTYTSTAVAFDEIAGGLDTVNLYWGTNNRTLEVSEIVVNRIS